MEQRKSPTIPQHTTCAAWCIDHDDEIGECIGVYQHTAISLEAPAVQMTRLETLNGEPVIVTFPTHNNGATFTPAEALQYAAQLVQLAIQAQAAQVQR